MSKRDTAKLLQFQRGQVQKRSASATAKAFTSKQSHYARRSEEEAIAREQVGTDDFLTSKFSGSQGKNAAPTFIGRTRKTNFGLNDDSNNLLALERAAGKGMMGLGQSIDESQIARDSETGEPLGGKRSRFEEILERSRDAKADKKVLRTEQEKETDKLDVDFNDISTLLQTKSKKQEAQESFYLLGTDKTRARLAEFFAERNASKGREFVLGANKQQLEKRGEIISNNEKRRRQLQQQQPPVAEKQPPQQSGSVVDPRVAALRATLPALPKRSQQQQQLPHQQIQQQTNQKPQQHNNEAEDSFDKLLGQMVFSRKAYAGDKTLSAEDQLLERFQDEVVDLERMKKDVAGRLVPEVQDTSRREWIQRGGDDVYRMGANEDEVKTSSTELLRNDKKKRQQEQQVSDDDEDGDDDIDFDGDVDYDDFDIDVDGIKSTGKLSKKSKKARVRQDSGADGEDFDQAGEDQDEDEVPTLNPIDESLAELESALASCKQSKQTGQIRNALERLHEACALRPRLAAESFRLIFLDIHALHAKRKPLTPFHLLVLRAAVNMFPMTDVSRHPVAAPLSSLLPSLMFSGPSLDSTRDAAVILFLASTMMDLLSGGARRNSLSAARPFFAAEPFVALLNVLSLQLPLSDLAPRGRSAKLAAPFPVFLRASEPVLGCASTSTKNAQHEDLLSLGDILFGTSETISSATVIQTTYELMAHYLETFLRHNPSCPCLIQDNIVSFVAPKILKANAAATCSEHVERKVKALLALSQDVVDQVLAERAPLAMRTFRPRPLRQYEPLLLDDSADEVKERRVIKKELREGKKRIIRSVQAEAAVERRKTEREARVEDAHRTAKLNSLMADLQAQQALMNHVDSIKAKGKSKYSKGISGEYDSAEGGEGGEGGGAAGDE